MKINSEKYYTVTIGGTQYATTGVSCAEIAKRYGVGVEAVKQGAVLGVLDRAPEPKPELCSYHQTEIEPIFAEQMVGDVSADVVVGYECPHCRQEYELSRAGQPQEITDVEIPF